MRLTLEGVPDLVAGLNELLDEVEADIGDGIEAVMYELVKATPYGDPSTWSMPAPPDYTPGTLRANWFVGVGQPNTTFDATIRMREPNAVVLREQSKIREGVGKVLFLCNSTHYVNKIEYGGHSKQAPQGMARVTLLRAPKILGDHL